MSVKVIVISVKGGTGKSFVSVNLAHGLTEYGKVACLDLDIDSPHIPSFLGARGYKIDLCEDGMTFVPAKLPGIKHDLLVNSMGMIMDMEGKGFLQSGRQHRQIIKDMINRTKWGKIDYWVVDCPAGSSDALDVITKLLGGSDGAIIVGIPNLPESVERCIDICSFRMIKVIGCIINFYGAEHCGERIVCSKCGKPFMPFKDIGTIEVCKKYGVEVLGTIPMNPDYSDTHIDMNLEAIKNAIKKIREVETLGKR